MDIAVFATGRLKKGAEAELAALYAGRFKAAAPALGLSFGGVAAAAESRAGAAEQRKAEEYAPLLRHLKPGGALILLDERGENLSSRAFAGLIGNWRDEGRPHLLLAVGGPDGFADAARARADKILSFGAMTWPHRLARIMLLEQLYRAATILAGHPYHRD